MPRRRPRELRPVARSRHPHRFSTLPGLSAGGRSAVVHLELTRFCPGAVADALVAARRELRNPFHRLNDHTGGCGIWECCPPPLQETRIVLLAAAAALPASDARRLRRVIAALDEAW